MTDKERITQNLPSLNEKELRELRARIDFLLRGETGRGRSNGNRNGNGSENPVDMVLGVIHRLCRDHGLESRSLSALKVGNSYNAFVEKVPQVLKSLGAADLDTRQLHTLLKLALGLTLEQLASMGVPVSASVLMNHVHRVPGVLDTHFPGYREAGMLKLIVRADRDEPDQDGANG